MSEHLVVSAGETYTIDAGATEEWLYADVDGTLEVNGTLKLIDDPDTPTQPTEADPFDVPTDPLDLPLSLDLPTQPLSIRTMETGLALFLMGLLTVIGGAAWVLRNYAAGVMWSLGIVALLLSGLLGIGLELFWAILLATLMLLAMGWIVRWIQ